MKPLSNNALTFKATRRHGEGRTSWFESVNDFCCPMIAVSLACAQPIIAILWYSMIFLLQPLQDRSGAGGWGHGGHGVLEMEYYWSRSLLYHDIVVVCRSVNLSVCLSVCGLKGWRGSTTDCARQLIYRAQFSLSEVKEQSCGGEARS